MNDSVMLWAKRHSVSSQAVLELREIFGIPARGIRVSGGEKEADIQARVRLEAAEKGVRLWRNNVGVMLNPKGAPVRFGLANDSGALNKVVKSGDLIGWRPVDIEERHVGCRIAQFVSRECKREGWVYRATEREVAQLAWAQLVVSDGGDAAFCTGPGTL